MRYTYADWYRDYGSKREEPVKEETILTGQFSVKDEIEEAEVITVSAGPEEEPLIEETMAEEIIENIDDEESKEEVVVNAYRPNLYKAKKD